MVSIASQCHLANNNYNNKLCRICYRLTDSITYSNLKAYPFYSPTHYASNSTKAELKVHVFLNVGHQRGCKVVTSSTSVKINVFLFRHVYDLYSFIAPWPN